jgi:hypothetical protein
MAEQLDGVRNALMDMSEAVVQPMREWLTGQRAYFVARGYTEDEARAMAAVTYVTVFGSTIKRTDEGS